MCSFTGLHTPIPKCDPCSLRIAVIVLFIVVFIVVVLIIFVFFFVRRISNVDIGSNGAIGGVWVEVFWRGIDPSEERLGPALVMRLLLDFPQEGGYFRPLAEHPTMAQAHLDSNETGPLVFLGGKDYLPLAHALTNHSRIDKVAFFRCAPSEVPTDHLVGDWLLKPYPTATRTNWHYSCAVALCDNPDIIGRP